MKDSLTKYQLSDEAKSFASNILEFSNCGVQHISMEPNEIGSVSYNNDCDFHLHSKYSLDGYLEPYQLVQRALKNGVQYIAITDHNSAAAINDIMESENKSQKDICYNYDGVQIFTGTELTCYYYIGTNSKTHMPYGIKIHMLCFGFERDPNNDIMNLIQNKYLSYKNEQYGLLNAIAGAVKSYNITREDVLKFIKEKADYKGFCGQFNISLCYEFIASQNLESPEMRKAFEDTKKKIKQYNFDPLKIDALDVTNATHDAGGYCVIAHPTQSLEKFRRKHLQSEDYYRFYTKVVDNMLLNGVDGVELAYLKNAINERFNNHYKNSFIRSFGSDLHYFTEENYKDIGKAQNDVSSVNIVEKLKELEKCHKDGSLTEKQKKNKKIKSQNSNLGYVI